MTEVEIVIQKQSLQNHKVPYIVPIVNFFPTFKFHYQKLQLATYCMSQN